MIPQYEPWIGEEELTQLADVVRANWVTEGNKTKEFEREVAEYCGVKHAVAVCNGTIALYVALKALGIGVGDEVIVPDFTFIASANSVKMAGATPVLVDVDIKTFNIDPDCVSQAITTKTKAIMPVHIYGQSADMDELLRIKDEYGLYIIEDAAQGIGVKFNGKHVGSFGNASCFSFYGNKTITTGEGGVILTSDDKVAEKCYMLKSHGTKQRGTYIHEDIGYNFRITDLQSAIGLAQLSKLDMILEMKSRNEIIYKDNLSSVTGIQFPRIDSRCDYVPWLINVLVDDPQNLREFLMKEGIETRPFFYPLHRQPCYNIRDEFPNSDYLYERGLSLPSSVLLTEEQIGYICEKINLFMER
ncbi:DegT/DnrJ/EryC1/StrS family aminotransferase [Chloroflexota bacterium]